MRFNILQLRNWLPGFLTDFFAEHPISASLISADADNALVEGTDDKLFVSQSEGGGGEDYLVYTILISQSGTSAPTAIILKNTLGGTPTFNRNTEALYGVNLAGAFPEDKTFIIFQSGGVGSVSIMEAYHFTDSVIRLAGSADGELNKRSLEIRVYP